MYIVPYTYVVYFSTVFLSEPLETVNGFKTKKQNGQHKYSNQLYKCSESQYTATREHTYVVHALVELKWTWSAKECVKNEVQIHNFLITSLAIFSYMFTQADELELRFIIKY